MPEEGEALVLADDGAPPAVGEGEVFVLACPQDRQFAQSSLGSLPGAVVYSGDEMEPAQAKERLAASRQCCVSAGAEQFSSKTSTTPSFSSLMFAALFH